MMIEPQLIHKATDSQLKACDDGTWFAQIKKDGALYMYVKGLNGENYLFGRTVSKKTGLLTEKSANVPHIIKAFRNVPNGTIILGEIYYPGKTSKDVTSIMGCLPEKAIERQNGSYGKIYYYIYDCLGYNGTSLLKYDNWTRFQVLESIWKKVIYPTFNKDFPPYLQIALPVEKDIYSAIGTVISMGEEGMVVKKKTALYEPGKRPMTMLKAKQVDTADVVIMGFRDPVMEYTGKEIETWQYWKDVETDTIWSPPALLYTPDYKERGLMPVTKPYYYGWKNAIEIGAYDEYGVLRCIGTIASGLGDWIKEDMSVNPQDYMYKVCEIQCMMKDKKEQTLRHGFFLRFRNDKDAKDCKLEDIFK